MAWQTSMGCSKPDFDSSSAQGLLLSPLNQAFQTSRFTRDCPVFESLSRRPRNVPFSDNLSRMSRFFHLIETGGEKTSKQY